MNYEIRKTRTIQLDECLIHNSAFIIHHLIRYHYSHIAFFVNNLPHQYHCEIGKVLRFHDVFHVAQRESVGY